ncbi:MAG: hypothetical protein WBA77_00110 [Microcoleaceae cyanobacterium]
MLIAVIFINVVIAILCLIIAQKVWRLRRALERTERLVLRLDRRIEAILRRATFLIDKGQTGAYQAQQQYQSLQQQILRVRKVMALFSLSQTVVWFWLNRRKPL